MRPGLAAWIAAAVLAGCSAAGGGDSSGECATDADCEGAALCLRGACVQACNSDDECGTERLCQRGVCVALVSVEIVDVTPSTLSQFGTTESTLRWRSSAAGSFALHTGASCLEGGTVLGTQVTGNTAGGVVETSSVSVLSLTEGLNDIWVCVTTEEGEYGAATTLQRADGPHPTTVDPGPGIYSDEVLVTLDCELAQVIAYTLDGTDPQIDAAGDILVGELYTDPFVLDRSADLRVRCLDLAGNLEGVQVVPFLLVPEIDILAVSSPVVTNTGLYPLATIDFTSTLSGTLAVMSSGSCNRGEPYPLLPGPVSRGVSTRITIRADELNDGEASYPIRICVTEPGGVENSTVVTITLDDTAPASLPPAGGVLCEEAIFACAGCTTLYWDVGQEPVVSAGALVSGYAAGPQLALTPADLGGFPATVYVRAADLAGNLEPAAAAVLFTAGGTAPTSSAPVSTEALIGPNAAPSSATVSFVADADLSYWIAAGSCAPSAATALASGQQADAPVNAADYAGPDCQPLPLLLCLTDPGGQCVRSTPLPLAVKSSACGFFAALPDLFLEPRLALLAADDPVTGGITGVNVVVTVARNFLVPAELVNAALPFTSTGGMADVPLGLHAVPETASLGVTATLTHTLVDGVGNPLPDTATIALPLTFTSRDDYVFPGGLPLGHAFGGVDPDLVAVDNQSGLAWLTVPRDCGGGGCDWPAALSECLALNTASPGGLSTWRLARWRELLSLVDDGALAAPFVHAPIAVLAGSPPFWSATDDPGAPGHDDAFALDFTTLATGPTPKADLLAALCVAGGNPHARPAFSRGDWAVTGAFFVHAGGEVLWDPTREIGWELDPVAVDLAAGTTVLDGLGNPLPQGPLVRDDAAARCALLASLGHGGSDGWFLPSLAHLALVVTPSSSARFIDPTLVVAADGSPPDYWTSSINGSGEFMAYDLDTDTTVPKATASDPADTALVRCATLGP